MLSRLKQSADYAIMIGAPTMAALSMRVHPLLPVIMTIALLGMLFIASNPHLLLVLLATVPLIKGALESNFPVFETIDYITFRPSVV